MKEALENAGFRLSYPRMVVYDKETAEGVHAKDAVRTLPAEGPKTPEEETRPEQTRG